MKSSKRNSRQPSPEDSAEDLEAAPIKSKRHNMFRQKTLAE
jgi:hypothetical protein